MIFKNLHPQSKIWLYISPVLIDSVTKKSISSLFNDFLENWKSHGQPVNGQLKFIKDNLLVVGADYFPNGMCGRAVDAQVRFINQINEGFNLDLLNRINIAFVEQDSIVVHNFNNLDALIKKDSVNKSTIYCNTFSTKNTDEIYLPFGESPFATTFFSE
jgi:hypothetical protein|tara:strand:- start:169 stop:645 length:477 start_codon:yes stop_codon:yes gene_type:complete